MPPWLIISAISRGWGRDNPGDRTTTAQNQRSGAKTCGPLAPDTSGAHTRAHKGGYLLKNEWALGWEDDAAAAVQVEEDALQNGADRHLSAGLSVVLRDVGGREAGEVSGAEAAFVH